MTPIRWISGCLALALIASLGVPNPVQADDFVVARSASQKLKVVGDTAKWCGPHLSLRMLLEADSPIQGSEVGQIGIMNRLKAPISADCPAAADATITVLSQGKPQGVFKAAKSQDWAFASTSPAPGKQAALDLDADQPIAAAKPSDKSP